MKNFLKLIALLAIPAIVIAACLTTKEEPDNSDLLTDYSRKSVERYVRESGNPGNSIKHVSPETLKAVMGEEAHTYNTDRVTSNAGLIDWPVAH